MGTKYRDEQWLRKKYVDEGLTQSEIADISGVHTKTILEWMKRNGIDSRKKGSKHDSRIEDAGWLREKYIDEGMSMTEIGDVLGCPSSDVSYWISKFDIPARDQYDSIPSGRNHHAWKENQFFHFNVEGRPEWIGHFKSERRSVKVHRLAAVAWFGWDAVVDNSVHHRIPAPWLTTESNLLPIPEDEHRIITWKYRKDGVPEEIVGDVLGGLG